MLIESNHQVHDKLFRRVLSDPKRAAIFLKSYLPKEIFEEIDLTGLTVQPNHFVTDLNDGLIADVILKSHFISMPTVPFYLLLEHQSQADRKIGMRILNYSTQLMASHCRHYHTWRVPCVYRILFYTGSKPYPHKLDLKEISIAPEVFKGHCVFPAIELIDLNEILRKDLLEGKEIIGMVMQHGLTVKELKEIVLKLKGLATFDEYEFMLRYLLRNKIEAEQVLTELKRDPKVGRNVMNIVEQLELAQFQRGLMKGKSEGKAEGKAEGKILGEMESRIKIASKLLKVINDNELISSITGLSITDLEELKETLH